LQIYHFYLQVGNSPHLFTSLLELVMNFPLDGFPTRPCRAVTTEPRYFSCQNEIQWWAIPDSFPLWSFGVMSTQALRNFISQSPKNSPAQPTATVEFVSSQAPKTLSLILQLAEVGFAGLSGASLGQSGTGSHLIFTRQFPLLHHAFPFLPRFSTTGISSLFFSFKIKL